MCGPRFRPGLDLDSAGVSLSDLASSLSLVGSLFDNSLMLVKKKKKNYYYSMI